CLTNSAAPIESAYRNGPPRNGAKPVPIIIAKSTSSGAATIRSSRQRADSLIMSKTMREESVSEDGTLSALDVPPPSDFGATSMYGIASGFGIGSLPLG